MKKIICVSVEVDDEKDHNIVVASVTTFADGATGIQADEPITISSNSETADLTGEIVRRFLSKANNAGQPSLFAVDPTSTKG